MPSPWNIVFSTSRSCDTSSARAEGHPGRRISRLAHFQTLGARTQLRQRERRHLRVEQAAFLVAQVLDLVERALQRAVTRRHQPGVLLRDLLEPLLHLVELRGVLLPL